MCDSSQAELNQANPILSYPLMESGRVIIISISQDEPRVTGGGEIWLLAPPARRPSTRSLFSSPFSVFLSGYYIYIYTYTSLLFLFQYNITQHSTTQGDVRAGDSDPANTHDTRFRQFFIDKRVYYTSKG